ncbi:head completion/stabilization protein [Hylemonella gracilis str. Niagara R]|uniref:Head completion/stabilization protein n=1 Tax=Hylemonella gracilis str. Niagara R TaxID=1458275 RepID=A0A016XH87_9BURK|nr:head completion/stabilization protein [Hylemonella gracilis]EYC51459.1 head completion/stabilization protein [Hylemonella gracilis str. Niagara R]
MSFIATETPPPAIAEPVIVNDGFFPDVDPKQLREDAALPGAITAPRLRQAVLRAILDVNRELEPWRARQVAAGHGSLAAVPAATVAGETSANVVYYRAAILSHVQAALAEQYRAIDTTGKGDSKAERLEATADDHRRNLRWAVAAILGRTNTVVELI